MTESGRHALVYEDLGPQSDSGSPTVATQDRARGDALADVRHVVDGRGAGSVRDDRGRVLSASVAEVLFAVLPLIVVLIIVLREGHSGRFLDSPEWSFGAAVLFGQALAKFVSGLARVGGADEGPVSLAVALLIVAGLAPALLILALTLIATEQQKDVGRWLELGQVVWFVGGALAYVVLGTVGESWRRRRDHK